MQSHYFNNSKKKFTFLKKEVPESTDLKRFTDMNVELALMAPYTVQCFGASQVAAEFFSKKLDCQYERIKQFLIQGAPQISSFDEKSLASSI